MPRRLTVLSQSYPPEPLPVTRWIPRALADHDWDVTVVTGVPNYPAGEVYPGYSSWMRTREKDGPMTVRRTPLYASHDTSAVRRVLNYTSWALSATVFGWRELRKSDAVLVYSTPATCAFPAMIARRLLGKPYVLLIEDVWPDSVFASGFLDRGFKRKLAQWALGAFCQATYRHSEHVAVTAPGMIDLLASRGVPREKLSLVYNWVDESVFHPSEPDPDLRNSLGLTADDFLIMYGGNHGLAQKLDVLIRAVASIDPAERVHVALIGDGVEKAKLQKLAHNLAPDRIHFLDPRPLAEMPATLAAADVSYSGLANRELFAITLPSKILSTLAIGEPIIVAVPGNATEVVQKAGAGWTAEAENVEDLKRVILTARKLSEHEREELGRSGLDFYRREISATVGARRLSDILKTAASRK